MLKCKTQRILFGLVVGLCVMHADGQDDLLRGPEIDAESRNSIVRYSISGSFEQVEGRPEMAAFVAVVTGSKKVASIDRAVEIAHQRTVDLSVLLIDEIDLLKESTDATLAGDQVRAREIQDQLYEMFDPQKRHDPLTPAIVELLDDQHRAQYEQVLEQYWEAWIDWLLRDREDRGDADVKKRAREQLTRQLYNQEMVEAYNISIRRYRDSLEAIYIAIEPTQEQRSEIRDIVIEHIKAMRVDASQEQRRQAMHEIYQMLDEERRVKLFDYLLRIAVPNAG